eukprot:6160133-Alexandrium_andersonii.AAC.1
MCSPPLRSSSTTWFGEARPEARRALLSVPLGLFGTRSGAAPRAPLEGPGAEALAASCRAGLEACGA